MKPDTHPLCASICMSRFSLLRRTSSFFFLSDGGLANEISIEAPPKSFPCRAPIAWNNNTKIESIWKHFLSFLSHENMQP